MTLSDLVAAIDSQRQHGNLSSAIRLFVLDFYRAQLSDAEERHNEAQQTMERTARAYLNSRGNALDRLSGAGALTSWYTSR
jgi:predicted DNA-binding ribbon-helix-helix protein